MMKYKNTMLANVLFAVVTLAVVSLASLAAKKESWLEDELAVIPASARFDERGIEAAQPYILVGRLSLWRRDMGSRADPPYVDVVRFHCFDGKRVQTPTFASPELENRLLELLANGSSIPAVITVVYQAKHVGHDGINTRMVWVPRIEACSLTSVEVICRAAEVAGFDAADSVRFQSAFSRE